MKYTVVLPLSLTGHDTPVHWAGMAYASLLCLFSSSIASAASPAAGPLAAWAIGLTNGYVVMEHQAQVVHVTAEDAARGMVEVRGASRLVVTTHAPSRYAVDFLNRSTVFRPTAINGMGDVTELSQRGGSVAQQHAAGRHVVAFDYRFALAPGTPPGTYPWPLSLTVRSVVAGNAAQVAPDSRDMMLSGQAEP